MGCLGPFPCHSSPCHGSQTLLAHALPRCLTLRAYPGFPDVRRWVTHLFCSLGAPPVFLLWGSWANTPGPLIPLNTHCARKAEVPGNPDPQPPPAYPLGPVLSKDGFRETGAGPESYGSIWQLTSTLAPITLQYVSQGQSFSSFPWKSHQVMSHPHALQEKAPFGELHLGLNPAPPASMPLYSETYPTRHSNLLPSLASFSTLTGDHRKSFHQADRSKRCLLIPYAFASTPFPPQS